MKPDTATTLDSVLKRQDYARRYNPQYLKCTSRVMPCKKTYETDKPNVFCNGGKAERLRKVDSCKKYEMCQKYGLNEAKYLQMNSKSNDENFIEIHCDDPLEDCSNPDDHGSNIKFNTLCPRELYELLMKNSERDYYLDD
uniref:Uncharacterized protein n=1 Tax=Romanomermis culicivorax TaxID=13658 RepID=A0A915HYL3_ROMCU